MTHPAMQQERDEIGEPVEDFGKFRWRSGRWKKIFDRQIELIQSELARAHAEDRAVVYLSCPISSRGGGSNRTNVDMANFTARRLMHTWGERVFVLNPAAYQMESREGTGLILDHVRSVLGATDPRRYLEQLTAEYRPGGGDCMQMWVKVLVEDKRYRDIVPDDKPKRGLSCGGMFDAFFLGPSDVASFFAPGQQSSTTQFVESYFARKYAMDLAFRREFNAEATSGDVEEGLEHRRKLFFRYYALRASASYSLGSRDEWNTLVRLNRKRRASDAYGPGEEIACYFDGRQVSPASANHIVPQGYELSDSGASIDHHGEIVWPK
jgi:hypothetical protein